MKRRMILIAMTVPCVAFSHLFSERSGEIFQTTREGPGEVSVGLIGVGILIPPLGLVTLPAGVAVGAVDELAVSPAVDLLCLPYDLSRPRHGFVLRVRDTGGDPVAGASVFANMEARGALGHVIRDTTDENGEIFVSKLNHVSFNRVEISAEGYYDYREYDGPWHRVCERRPDADGRIAFDFVAKKKIRPVKKINAGIEIPDSVRWRSAEMFFDCEKGDWLPPYGKGLTGDLKLTHSFECKDSKRPKAAYRKVIRIEAVGPGNGFLRDTCNWYDGLPGAYQVPSEARFEDEAITAIYCWKWEDGGSAGTREFDQSTYCLLRLRTRLSEDGRVMGAHYGKLFFHVGVGSLAQTLFVCEENERWLE